MESTLNPIISAYEAEVHSELPPGFRFHPTDEELVSYYLTKKIMDSTISGLAIGEADLNKCEPWDLPAKSKMGEKEWYVFCLRDRKYPRGVRTDRATEAGYWKTSGNDRGVFNSLSSALVGKKKTLVFYKGRAPKGEKTNWVMHEYRLEGKFSYDHLPKDCNLDDWVVCRIFEKSARRRKSSIGLISRNASFDLPRSPSLPSLLKSPCSETAANDREARSSESDSGASAKLQDMSYFSTPMEPMANLTGNCLHQFQCGNSSCYPDNSDHLSEMTRLISHSSNMHNNMNDLSIYMNIMPTSAPFSTSNMQHDQISAIHNKQTGIQQQPGFPTPISCNQPMPLPYNSSKPEFATYPYFSTLHPSYAVSKALVKQYVLMATEPSSISFANESTGPHNDINSMEVNNSDNSFQWASDDFSKKALDQHVLGRFQERDSSTDMKAEMSFSVCSLLVDRPVDQPHFSLAPSVDISSLI
eukprot:PITA_08805